MNEYIKRECVHKSLDDLSNENLIGNDDDTFISLAKAHDKIQELPAENVYPMSVEAYGEIIGIMAANELLKKYELLLFLTLCNSFKSSRLTMRQSAIVAVKTMREMLEMLDSESVEKLYNEAKEVVDNA